MNRFFTDSFNFFQYNPDTESHRNFLEDIRKDEKIKDQLLDEELINSLSYFDENDFQSFLVGNQNDNIIGYLGIDSTGGHLELEWAILEQFRGLRFNSYETVGSRMIRESSNYLLSLHREIKAIRAHIFDENISSIKAALHAGFKYVDGVLYTKEKVTAYISNPKGLITRSK